MYRVKHIVNIQKILTNNISNKQIKITKVKYSMEKSFVLIPYIIYVQVYNEIQSGHTKDIDGFNEQILIECKVQYEDRVGRDSMGYSRDGGQIECKVQCGVQCGQQEDIL